MNTRTALQRVSLFAAGVTMLCGCAPSDSRIGTTAPDFELEDTSGVKVALSKQKGHVVLLSFWAVG